jgi:hypothetical protein
MVMITTTATRRRPLRTQLRQVQMHQRPLLEMELEEERKKFMATSRRVSLSLLARSTKLLPECRRQAVVKVRQTLLHEEERQLPLRAPPRLHPPSRHRGRPIITTTIITTGIEGKRYLPPDLPRLCLSKMRIPPIRLWPFLQRTWIFCGDRIGMMRRTRLRQGPCKLD